MARSGNQSEEQSSEEPTVETSQPLGSTWELGTRKGQTVEITRPDESVVTVSRGLHVLDLSGEYVARRGDVEQRVTAK